MALAVALSSASASGQWFQHDYGLPAQPEIGTAMIELTGGTGGYAVVGTRNPGNLLVGTAFNRSGRAPIESTYAPMLVGGVGVVPHCMRAVAGGGTIVGGELSAAGFPGIPGEIWLGRFDAVGAPVWGFLYRGSATGIRRGTRVIEARVPGLAAGGFAAIGNLTGGFPSNRGVFFMVNGAGALVSGGWGSYGLDWPVFFDDLRQNADGTFIILGRLQEGGTAAPRVTMLLQLSPLGVPLCATIYAGAAPTDDVEQQALAVTADGNYVVWGHYGPTAPRRGSFLFKAARRQNACPAPLWRTEFPGIFGTRPTVTEDFKGNLVCNGFLANDGVLLWTNAGGLAPFARKCGPPGPARVDQFYQVITGLRGGFAACGSTEVVDASPSSNLYVVTADKNRETCSPSEVPQFSTRTVTAQDRQIQVQGPGTQMTFPVGRIFTVPVDRELCFEPYCVDVPLGNTLWLPFDEAARLVARNIAFGSRRGTLVNGPILSPGKVAQSLCFDGVDDHVTVPSYPGIEVGMGDFTIDAWVKLPSLSGQVIPIVDKRDSLNSYRGYTLYLSSSGQVALQMSDGVGGPPYSSYVSSLATLRVPADNAWHFVAVTVSRTGTSRFYLDKNVETFSAIGESGNLNNVGPPQPPLLVARNVDGPHLHGCIDEVEIFRRRLSVQELDAIFDAGHKGKCKQRLTIASTRTLCTGQNAAVVTGSIFNGTDAPTTYTCWFRGIVDGPGCTVQGPTTFAPAGPITVGPIASGASGSFSLTVTRPAGMTRANLTGCFDVFAESSSGETLSARSDLVDRRDVCVSGAGWDGSVTEVDAGVVQAMGPITISNTSGAPLTLNYRLVAMTDGLDLDTEALSLNGLPPGTPVTGTVQIGAGGSTVLNATAEFVAPDGHHTYTVRLEADMDGDGAFDFLGGRELRSLLDVVGARAVAYGTGCGGVTLNSTLPFLGDTATMTLGGVPSGSLGGLGILGSVQFPGLDLSQIGMPGCALLVNQLGTLPGTIAPPNGVILLPIPNLVNLVGVQIGGQAAVVSPGANALGVLMSNGVSLTLSDG